MREDATTYARTHNRNRNRNRNHKQTHKKIRRTMEFVWRVSYRADWFITTASDMCCRQMM
jgi:hypothetical protein